MTAQEVCSRGETTFVIAPSQADSERASLVSADVATCVDCLHELFDAADRRFRCPFINGRSPSPEPGEG